MATTYFLQQNCWFKWLITSFLCSRLSHTVHCFTYAIGDTLPFDSLALWVGIWNPKKSPLKSCQISMIETASGLWSRNSSSFATWSHHVTHGTNARKSCQIQGGATILILSNQLAGNVEIIMRDVAPQTQKHFKETVLLNMPIKTGNILAGVSQLHPPEWLHLLQDPSRSGFPGRCPMVLGGDPTARTAQRHHHTADFVLQKWSSTLLSPIDTKAPLQLPL